MSPRSLGLVAITVMGLWHLLQAVAYSTWLVPPLLDTDPELSEIALGYVPSFVANGLVAAVLLVFRNRIASALLPDLPPSQASPDLLYPFFSVAGLILTVFAIQAMVATEFDHLYRERIVRDEMENPLFQLQPTTYLWTERVRHGTQLVLGLAVLFGAQGLAGAMRLFREAGRKK